MLGLILERWPVHATESLNCLSRKKYNITMVPFNLETKSKWYKNFKRKSTRLSELVLFDFRQDTCVTSCK